MQSQNESSSTKENLNKLTDWFSNKTKSVIVALSGGVDSAVVALAAKKALGLNALSITANYKTLSAEELSSAERIAKEIGIAHITIEYNELENSEFVKNDELRCYHCRNELGERLVSEAHKYGIDLIVDGTNTDDLNDYRPGIVALRKKGIKSPLAEIGLDKSQIRAIALEYGLSVYNKPSNACLASRIPRGISVTAEKLGRIEKSEIIVKRVATVEQVRVRDHGEIARIEIAPSELTKLFDVDKLTKIDVELRNLGFKYVTVDIRGYRSGNLVVIPE
ncbi:MAG TPA: ATP-dependent sacrificial sulfur transferase LarE [Nitrososphaeraceae archaeon]|nr:ATP-dependent sacrificial sulfur transferase LarE [Nitrososphaeraceae archaeon]